MADEVHILVEGFQEGLQVSAQSWSRSESPWPGWSKDDLDQFGKMMARNVDAFLRARPSLDIDAAVDFLAGEFALHLKTLLAENPDVSRAFLAIGPRELSSSATDSAVEMIAPLLWRQRIGETLETGDVVRLLDISRQAVHKKVRSGTILGIPGNRTTLFPGWQFDMHAMSVRPGVAELIEQFRSQLGEDVDSLLIASWATTRQEEDLDGRTPSQMLGDPETDPEVVITAARRAAARLAQ